LTDEEIMELAQSDQFESAGATPYCFSEDAIVAFARALLAAQGKDRT